MRNDLNVNSGHTPNIMRITTLCRELPGFLAAAPENQPDAEIN